MVRFVSIATASLFLASATAMPLRKRIAQSISDATHDWEQACDKAGGGQQCNPVSVKAFTTLLAAADPCAQQNSGDEMIDLAHTLNSDPEMIRLTQLFVQQPRNAPDSLQVPYCQTAPKNSELAGLFHCEFAGSKFPQFSGDQSGILPLGVAAVNPAGSCPAHPAGPIPDGVQLNSLVTDPGVSSSSGGSSSGGNSTDTGSATSTDTASATSTDTGSATSTADPSAPTITSVCAGTVTISTTVTVTSTDAPASAAVTDSSGATSTASAPAATTTDFHLLNGQDAIALNDKFAALTADSTCTDGDQACVNGGFAQCLGGKFEVSQCATGLKCFALPLVNKRGTTITCDTPADAQSRIAATGATDAGSSGAGSSGAASSSAAPADSTDPTSTVSASAAAPTSTSGDFHLLNGQDAIALNKKFAALTADSTCTDGDQACVGGGFAQCVGGKFAVTQCATSLQCFALPLVNKRGTSLGCDTPADANSRIAATGATP